MNTQDLIDWAIWADFMVPAMVLALAMGCVLTLVVLAGEKDSYVRRYTWNAIKGSRFWDFGWIPLGIMLLAYVLWASIYFPVSDLYNDSLMYKLVYHLDKVWMTLARPELALIIIAYMRRPWFRRHLETGMASTAWVLARGCSSIECGETDFSRHARQDLRNARMVCQ